MQQVEERILEADARAFWKEHFLRETEVLWTDFEPRLLDAIGLAPLLGAHPGQSMDSSMDGVEEELPLEPTPEQLARATISQLEVTFTFILK